MGCLRLLQDVSLFREAAHHFPKSLVFSKNKNAKKQAKRLANQQPVSLALLFRETEIKV